MDKDSRYNKLKKFLKEDLKEELVEDLVNNIRVQTMISDGGNNYVNIITSTYFGDKFIRSESMMVSKNVFTDPGMFQFNPYTTTIGTITTPGTGSLSGF